MQAKQASTAGWVVKALAIGSLALGVFNATAADFSVGRVDIKFAEEGWKEVPLPEQSMAYGGDKEGALAVRAKLFVRNGSPNEGPVLMLVSANSEGMGGGRGGYMTYSTECKSDEHNYREGNEGFRASFAQCLMVTPRYHGPSVIKALAPQLEGVLKPEGSELPPFFTVWSRHAISTGSFVDVRVFTVFPVRGDGTAISDPIPKEVPPAQVAWGRQLKDAVKSSVYSLSGRLDIPPIRLDAPPPAPAASGS